MSRGSCPACEDHPRARSVMVRLLRSVRDAIADLLESHRMTCDASQQTRPPAPPLRPDDQAGTLSNVCRVVHHVHHPLSVILSGMATGKAAPVSHRSPPRQRRALLLRQAGELA